MRILAIIFMLLLSNAIYSQEVYQVNGDTMVCLTNEQTQKVLLLLNDRDRLMELDSINKKLLAVCDTTNQNMKSQVAILEKVVEVKEQTNIVLQTSLNQCNTDNARLEKSLKRERRWKNGFIITSGIMAGFIAAILLL